MQPVEAPSRRATWQRPACGACDQGERTGDGGLGERDWWLGHGPPEIATLPLNRYKDLVEMPRVTQSPLTMPKPLGKQWSNLHTPLAHGFVTDRHPAVSQQLFAIAKAEAETMIEPYSV